MDWLGLNLGTTAKFGIALLIVLALIGVTAFILKRFGSGAMPTSGGGRNRQPRLAVLDSAVVDAKRRLVLIRRDNSEHLLLIGGPSDVVVETNINRAGPGTASAERRTRGIPQPDLEAFESALLPEPEFEMPPQPTQRTPAPSARTRETTPRPQLRPQPEPEAFDDLPLVPPLRPEPQQEPAAYSPPPPLPRAAAHPSAASSPSAPPARSEPNYSDMQQKMEAALRNPATPPAPPPARAPEPRASQPAPRPAPPPMPQTRPMPPAPAPRAAETPAPSRQAAPNPFDSLEAEMASLLGQGKKS